jgi:hypothetical protein
MGRACCNVVFLAVPCARYELKLQALSNLSKHKGGGDEKDNTKLEELLGKDLLELMQRLRKDQNFRFWSKMKGPESANAVCDQY